MEGEQGEGPRGVPAPQSSWGLLTQDEGPTSGKDRGCVLNPTEGGSEVSRGAAGLENGDRVWTRKTQGQRKGQQDSSKHGGSGLPLGRQGGRGGEAAAEAAGPEGAQAPRCLPSPAEGWSPFLPPSLPSPSGPRSPGRRLPSRRVPQSPFVLPTVRPPPLPSAAQVRVWLRGAVSLTVMHLGHGRDSRAQWAAGRPATSGHSSPGAARGAEALLKKRPIVVFGGSPSQGFMKQKRALRSHWSHSTQRATPSRASGQTNSCLPGTAARGLGPGRLGHRELAQVQGCGAPSQETKAKERGQRPGHSSLLSVGFYEATGLSSQRPESKGCWQGANPQQPRVKALQSEAKLPG